MTFWLQGLFTTYTVVSIWSASSKHLLGEQQNVLGVVVRQEGKAALMEWLRKVCTKCEIFDFTFKHKTKIPKMDEGGLVRMSSENSQYDVESIDKNGILAYGLEHEIELIEGEIEHLKQGSSSRKLC